MEKEIIRLKEILDDLGDSSPEGYYNALLMSVGIDTFMTRHNLERILTKRYGVKSLLVYEVVDLCRKISTGVRGSTADTMDSKRFEIMRRIMI